jgi:hypothetical protein
MPRRLDFVAKIYWVPVDPEIARTVQRAVVVQAQDNPAVEPVIIDIGSEPESSATGVGGGAASSGGRNFWASGVPLSAVERWRLTAEAPDHRGCFEFTLST